MKLLLEHLKNNKEALTYLSKLIGIANHPVNIGTAREGLISNFLEKNLPEFIRYHSGEIFDSKGNRSGQIDIVLHPITSPKIYLNNNINMFPAETVLCALEVKSNLTTGKNSHLDASLELCKKIKNLIISRRKSEYQFSPYVVDADKVPYIIFAYKGPLLKTLSKSISEYSKREDFTSRDLPDLIVVLDRGYYLVKNKNWHTYEASSEDLYMVFENVNYTLLGIFEYILKLVECWSLNQAGHVLPIEEYTQDGSYTSLDEFFK